MAIEYEVKFQADAGILAALKAEYSQYPLEQFSMQTTYYDTPSGALSARHYTLRRRMENGVSVCTLKMPAENGGRSETELLCSDIHAAAADFSLNANAPGLSEALKEGLIPVCGAQFHRDAICIPLEDCMVELALDSGSLTGGENSLPLCEVEVELKQGERLSADLFATLLADRYQLKPEKYSKFRRALALYKGESL